MYTSRPSLKQFCKCLWLFVDNYMHDILKLCSLFGTHDECCERETLAEFILVQGLMGKQEAIVQHIERLKKGSINLHLTQEPRALLICHINKEPKD